MSNPPGCRVSRPRTAIPFRKDPSRQDLHQTSPNPVACPFPSACQWVGAGVDFPANLAMVPAAPPALT
jgi:hypothetical protein